jgi:hypothetical protein
MQRPLLPQAFRPSRNVKGAIPIPRFAIVEAINASKPLAGSFFGSRSVEAVWFLSLLGAGTHAASEFWSSRAGDYESKDLWANS